MVKWTRLFLFYIIAITLLYLLTPFIPCEESRGIVTVIILTIHLIMIYLGRNIAKSTIMDLHTRFFVTNGFALLNLLLLYFYLQFSTFVVKC